MSKYEECNSKYEQQSSLQHSNCCNNCRTGTPDSKGCPGPQGCPGPKGDMGDMGPPGMRGPAGPQGPQGIPGAAGAIGPVGPIGLQGPSGAAGATGPTGPAGSAGPDGPQGPQGPQGIPGTTGATGASGTDGRSAYQVAVDQGYTGTEEEWLSGLEGPAGPAGPPGVTEIFGIHARLINSPNINIADEAPILFDTVTTQIGTTIVYDNTTGVFTISRNGYYLVNWWVALDGSTVTTGANFSLNVNGVSHSTGASPIVTGQLSGSAIIVVNAQPATITLTNESGEALNLEDLYAQANITILAIPIPEG